MDVTCNACGRTLRIHVDRDLRRMEYVLHQLVTGKLRALGWYTTGRGDLDICPGCITTGLHTPELLGADRC
jgi:hypothetical protein